MDPKPLDRDAALAIAQRALTRTWEPLALPTCGYAVHMRRLLPTERDVVTVWAFAPLDNTTADNDAQFAAALSRQAVGCVRYGCVDADGRPLFETFAEAQQFLDGLALDDAATLVQWHRATPDDPVGDVQEGEGSSGETPDSVTSTGSPGSSDGSPANSGTSQPTS